MDCGVDELGAVQHRPCADAWRQDAVDLLDLGVRGCRHGSAVPPDQHQRGAEDYLLAVHTCAAGSQLASERDLRDVLDPHRHRPTCRNDDVLDLAEVLDPPAHADHVAFAVALDVVGTPADIVGFNRADDLAEREPIGDKTHRIGVYMVLLHIAADCVGTCDPWHGPHLRSDDPVLNRP